MLQEKLIDIWMPIQAAMADALSPKTDIPIYLNQLLLALSHKHTAMCLQGYILENDMRFVFTESEAAAICEVHRRYYEYFSSVFLYNQQLYIDLQTSEYHIHTYDSILIVEY